MGEMNSPEFDLNELMQRLEAEVKRRRPATPEPAAVPQQPMAAQGVIASQPSSPSQPSQDLPIPQPIQLKLPQQDTIVYKPAFRPAVNGRYHLKDLLEYHDRDFIDAAYRTLMHRSPDEEGFVTYLGHLRDGMPKVEILSAMRDSPEGRAVGAAVAGLSLQSAILKICRWPLIGSFVRVVIAMWNLPEAERRRRALEGQIMSRIEDGSVKTRDAQIVVHGALRNLEDGYRLLTAYAASKPGIDALNHVESSINLANDALGSLRTSINRKANAEEVQLSLTEIRCSLQNLQTAKAEAADLARLITQFSNECAALQALYVAKADQSSLDEMRQLFVRAIETRPERYELTELTNHLVAIAQARLTKDDIAPLEQAYDGLRQQWNADRVTFECAIDQLKALLETANSDTRATIETSLQGVHRVLASLAQSKADCGALDDLRAEVKAGLETDLSRLRQAVRALSESKADQTLLQAYKADLQASAEATRTEIGAKLQLTARDLSQSIESLAQSKLERGALEPMRAEIKASVDAALGALGQTVMALSQTKADCVAFDDALAEIRASMEENLRRSEKALQNAFGPVNAQTQGMKRNLFDQERRLGLLLEEARKRLPAPISTEQIQAMLVEDDHLLDAFYASFEDRMRGTRADIKQRASIYIPYIRSANAGLLRSPVVDLGCGRGEWLELLRDEGLVGRGVDLNRIFLNACREIDLDVTEADALAFLRGLKPRSVGAVTTFHLIEHLPLKALIALLDESLRVLKPGGVVILETPNPENLQVGGCNFYTDPTHRRPIPPVLTEALLELRGFLRPVVVRREQERMRKLAPSRIAGDQELAANINPIVEVMLSNFFVSPDYGIIATKA